MAVGREKSRVNPTPGKGEGAEAEELQQDFLIVDDAQKKQGWSGQRPVPGQEPGQAGGGERGHDGYLLQENCVAADTLII